MRRAETLTTRRGQVRYLLDSVEGLNDLDDPRRKLLLTLMYWKVFDNINIPAEVLQEILSKGTNPETITREARRVNMGKRQLEGEQQNASDNRL